MGGDVYFYLYSRRYIKKAVMAFPPFNFFSYSSLNNICRIIGKRRYKARTHIRQKKPQLAI
jgi:hypothetical protein